LEFLYSVIGWRPRQTKRYRQANLEFLYPLITWRPANKTIEFKKQKNTELVVMKVCKIMSIKT